MEKETAYLIGQVIGVAILFTLFLCIFVVLPLIFAFGLNRKLVCRHSYIWGYYYGICRLLFGILLCLFLIFYPEPASILPTLVILLLPVTGWFIVRRKLWAWVLDLFLGAMIPFMLPITIVNMVYIYRRWEELKGVTQPQPFQKELAVVGASLLASVSCLVFMVISMSVLSSWPVASNATLDAFRPNLQIQSPIALAANTLSSEDIFTKVAPATFLILGKSGRNGTVFGTGFSVTIGGKPWIVTSRHVVEAAEELMLLQGQSSRTRYVWWENKLHDVALIEAWPDIPSIPINKSTPHPGSRAFVVGHPLGEGISINEGIISATSKEVIRFSTPIAQGASGSPLLNQAGQVIGVVTAINELGQNFNYALPIIDIQGDRWDKAPKHRGLRMGAFKNKFNN